MSRKRKRRKNRPSKSSGHSGSNRQSRQTKQKEAPPEESRPKAPILLKRQREVARRPDNSQAPPQPGSLGWAERVIGNFRGDTASLLRILEVYVMYNHSRISIEASEFFQKEIAWLTAKTGQQPAGRVRPFARPNQDRPVFRSA